LLDNNIIYAQELVGMNLNCSHYYPKYIAWKKIWKKELENIEEFWKTRKYMQQIEILKNKKIPQDVKDAYLDFVSWKLDNDWHSYSIVSKTDMRIYMFSNRNILLSRQNVGIGKHVWDQKNILGISKTTPGWMYLVWYKFEKDTDWKSLIDNEYWTHYIRLKALDWQFDIDKDYSLWFHWAWLKEKEQRLAALESQWTNDNRFSGWCLNTKIDIFWELYNHLDTYWKVYVTYEPDSNAIQDFKEQIK
jgi:hypothetical protein